MKDIHQLRVTIKQILDSQRLAVLATQGDGSPYGSLVAFAATENMKNLLFATTRTTRKYANLLKNRGQWSSTPGQTRQQTLQMLPL